MDVKKVMRWHSYRLQCDIKKEQQIRGTVKSQEFCSLHPSLSVVWPCLVHSWLWQITGVHTVILYTWTLLNIPM